MVIGSGPDDLSLRGDACCCCTQIRLILIIVKCHGYRILTKESRSWVLINIYYCWYLRHHHCQHYDYHGYHHDHRHYPCYMACNPPCTISICKSYVSTNQIIWTFRLLMAATYEPKLQTYLKHPVRWLNVHGEWTMKWTWKKHFIILYHVLMWYDPLYVFNTLNRLSTLLKGQKATTMTWRIPHSQINTFVVSLLKKLYRRSPGIGPWGLREIQRITLRFNTW